MRHLSPVLPNAPVHQSKASSDKHAERICDPVTHVWAAVAGRLCELNYAAKGDEDGDQSEPTSAGQWKGKSREGNEVYEFIAPIRCWEMAHQAARASQRLRRSHDNGEGDVEILARFQRLSARVTQSYVLNW